MAKALVLYHSQEYGNTGKMAKAVADGLKAGGCEVTLFNTNESRYPIEDFSKYMCVAFGTPDYYSYIAGGLKTFMDDHYIADVRKGVKGLRGKPYICFYTHGGGGNVKNTFSIFKRIGSIVGEPIGCQGEPDKETLEKLKNLGKELAKKV